MKTLSSVLLCILLGITSLGAQNPASNPFPFTNEVQTFLVNTSRMDTPPAVTGFTKGDYLSVMNGIVEFFREWQDERGAIIDRYTGGERQYSTPAFACAGTILYDSGYNVTILEAVLKAMDVSISDLLNRTTADNHPDFYIPMIMTAYSKLKPHVSGQRLRTWENMFREIDPERTYRNVAGSNQTHIANWNVVALCGEYLRHMNGLSENNEFVTGYMKRQTKRMTVNGMYMDPGVPMAYDLFPRLYFWLMLSHKYSGYYAKELRELMTRGAWMSLFMQSPSGEAPAGGRSAHHQWNEALEAAVFEMMADYLNKNGRIQAARSFKRGAHLALESIMRWIRPSGELWIVKNKFEPEKRVGFEGYSFHSQYNLLTAFILGIASLHADDSIEEGPAPADIGGFVLHIPSHHKVIANAGGNYIEIDTKADLHYNPTGIIRLHRRDMYPQIGPSDGITAHPGYQVPEQPEASYALGPGWTSGKGSWRWLASISGDSLINTEVMVLEASPRRAEFRIKYDFISGVCSSLTETVTVTKNKIAITDRAEGRINKLRISVPILIFDGNSYSSISINDNNIVISLNGKEQEFYFPDPSISLHREDREYLFRNGRAAVIFAEIDGSEISYEIKNPVPKSE